MSIASPPEPQFKAVVLIIDFDLSLHDNLKGMLQAQNYQCLLVDDIKQAVELTETQTIDLLIISGRHCLCGHIDEIRGVGSGYLPVLVVVDDLSHCVISACAELEVDDFITTPIDPLLMVYKVRSMLRLRQLYQREIDSRNQLLAYWQKVDLEQEVAAKVFNNVLKRNFLETEVVETVLSPMALFNGDLVLVTRTPDNHLYLLLGDFTGHGLSASIAATPAADVFYGMAKKGFALTEILTEINNRLHRMLPTNMFLAATGIALYPDSKSLSLITCGLPDHFLINHQSKTSITIASSNIPLGILGNMEFVEQNFMVSGEDSLYLMTDGVFECESPSGEAFGVERIKQLLMSDCGDRLTHLKASLAEHSQGRGPQDDLTLVKLRCDVENAPWSAQIKAESTDSENPNQAPCPIESLTWKSIMEFDCDALKQVNPVPLMVNTLMDIQGLQDHRQAIFMIVSELFANALDHGVLKLDSGIKRSPEGFMRFYEMKEQRLAELTTGSIRLMFAHQPTKTGGRLVIKVKDSGEGFNWNKDKQSLAQNDGYCGRGIILVNTLCSDLQYQGCGNRVVAVFDWRH